MKLYLISQDVNPGYDTYDSAVVSAKSEADARTIHPSGGEYSEESSYDWVSYSKIEAISVEYLGKTDKPRGVILASFNAG
jgi:hypothetical protein